MNSNVSPALFLGIGLLLIWAAFTGRLQGLWNVITNPAPVPAATQTKTLVNNAGGNA